MYKLQAKGEMKVEVMEVEKEDNEQYAT